MPMRHKIRAWFWDHFHPDRKRFLFLRQLRRIDGWITRLESVSPHAREFILLAERAVYVNHPPRCPSRPSSLPGPGVSRVSPLGMAKFQARNPDTPEPLLDRAEGFPILGGGE